MPEVRTSMRTSARAVPAAACLALALASWLAPGTLGAQARPGAFEGAGPSDTLRLDLGAAVRTAALRSASVELQRLSSVEAEARVVDERAALLPSLSVDASQGQRTFNTASFGLDFPTPAGQDPLFDPAGEVVGPVETVDFRARLAQTLFDWSALQRLRGARASLSATRVGEEVARERAAAQAAAAWVRASRAQRSLRAREEDVALAQQLLAVAGDLLDAGVGVRIDVTRAEAQLASMRSALVAAGGEAERSLLGLKRSLNVSLDRPVILVDPVETPDSLPADDPAAAPVVARALGRRPDLRAMDRRIDAASLEVAALEAERLPTLSLQAGDGFTGGGYGRLLNTWEWVLQVSVPVFDGFARSARLDEERARVSALETRRGELAQQVAFNVRDALLRLRAARELVAASRARLELAEAEVAQARERFQAGVTGSADLFTASLRLNEARTAQVDALAGWQEARVSLAAAEGSITELR